MQNNTYYNNVKIYSILLKSVKGVINIQSKMFNLNEEYEPWTSDSLDYGANHYWWRVDGVIELEVQEGWVKKAPEWGASKFVPFT